MKTNFIKCLLLLIACVSCWAAGAALPPLNMPTAPHDEPTEQWIVLNRVQALYLGHYNFQLHVSQQQLSNHETIISNYLRHDFIPFLEKVGNEAAAYPPQEQEKIAASYSNAYTEHIKKLVHLFLHNQSRYIVLDILDESATGRAMDQLVQEALERGSFLISPEELAKGPRTK